MILNDRLLQIDMFNSKCSSYCCCDVFTILVLERVNIFCSSPRWSLLKWRSHPLHSAKIFGQRLTDFPLCLIPDGKHILKMIPEAWHQTGGTYFINQYQALNVRRPPWFNPFVLHHQSPINWDNSMCHIGNYNVDFRWIWLFIHRHQPIRDQIVTISKIVK